MIAEPSPACNKYHTLIAYPVGSDREISKSDLVAEIDGGGFDGSCLERRWLADAGLAVGAG